MRQLALGDRRLAPLDGCPEKLDRPELPSALGELALGCPTRLSRSVSSAASVAQLGVTVVELGGAVPQHLLDGGAQPQRLLLAALQVGDRGVELLGA